LKEEFMIKTIRPKLEFLSKEFIQKIIEEAHEILEKQGVFVENKEALRLFKEAGMRVEAQTQRVYITYRKEHTFPGIIDRDTYDYWVSLGKKSIADKASEEVERLLQENPPSLLNEDIIQELQKIMNSDAKTYGMNSLPEIKP